jgi:hypothetical protein
MDNEIVKRSLKRAEEYAQAIQAEQEFKTVHWKESIVELKALPDVVNFAGDILNEIPEGELDFRNKLILSRYFTFAGARTRKQGRGCVKSLPVNIGYRITNSSRHPFPYKGLTGELVGNAEDWKAKPQLLSLATKIIAPKESVTFSKYEMYLLTINPLSYGYGVNFEVRFRGDDLYVVAPSFSTSDDFNVTSVIDENSELKEEFEGNLGIRIDVGIKWWEALRHNKKEITGELALRLAKVHKRIKINGVDIGV